VNEPADQEVRIPNDVRGPFLEERRVTGRTHHAGAQKALVVYYRRGGYSIVTAQGADHSARPNRLSRPVTVCEILRGRHTTTFALQLPALGAATFFDTTVALRWEVTDYQLVAEKRLKDVKEDLGPEIVYRLREVSEAFPVEQAQEANQAIRAGIDTGRWADLGSEVGLRTWMFVDLGTDRTHRDQVAGDRVDRAVSNRFRGFHGLAQGSKEARIAYLMASGNREDAVQLIRMLEDGEQQQRREVMDILQRLLDQDRLTSPEFDQYLQKLGVVPPDTADAPDGRRQLPPGRAAGRKRDGTGRAAHTRASRPGPDGAGAAHREPAGRWDDGQETVYEVHQVSRDTTSANGYGPAAGEDRRATAADDTEDLWTDDAG
jgi:hypothetical protein